MPPKTQAYYDRQKAKDQKKKANEMAVIRKEHEAAGTSNAREEELDAVRRRLALKGLHIADVAADGNCLFAAFAQQLALHCALPDSPSAVRHSACASLQANIAEFTEFMSADELTAYIATMKNDGTWGGELELIALAKKYNVNVTLVQADSETTWTPPAAVSTTLTLVLLRHFYTLGAHYGGTCPDVG